MEAEKKVLMENYKDTLRALRRQVNRTQGVASTLHNVKTAMAKDLKQYGENPTTEKYDKLFKQETELIIQLSEEQKVEEAIDAIRENLETILKIKGASSQEIKTTIRDILIEQLTLEGEL